MKTRLDNQLQEFVRKKQYVSIEQLSNYGQAAQLNKKPVREELWGNTAIFKFSHSALNLLHKQDQKFKMSIAYSIVRLSTQA